MSLVLRLLVPEEKSYLSMRAVSNPEERGREGEKGREKEMGGGRKGEDYLNIKVENREMWEGKEEDNC